MEFENSEFLKELHKTLNKKLTEEEILAELRKELHGGYEHLKTFRGDPNYPGSWLSNKYKKENAYRANAFFALLECDIEAFQDNIEAYLDEIEELTFDDLYLSFIIIYKNAYKCFWEHLAEKLKMLGCGDSVYHMCLALEQFYYGDKDMMVEFLVQVISEYDEAIVAWELLANYYYDNNMFKNALSYYKKIVEYDEEWFIKKPRYIFFNIGYCYSKVRDIDCAIESYMEAYNMEGNTIPFYLLNNLGYCLYKKGIYLEAQKYLEESIERKLGDKYPYNNMISVLLAMKQYGEAANFVERNKNMLSKESCRKVEKICAKYETEDVILEEGEIEVIFVDDEYEEIEDEFVIDDEEVLPFPEFSYEYDDIHVHERDKRFSNQFYSEKALEDEVIAELEREIPIFGIKLHIYDRETYGRQYILKDGKGKRIDILAEDDDENLYVIELKKDSGYDDPYAQITYYVEWIQENLCPKGKKTYGIICLNGARDKTIKDVKSDSRIMLYEYSISFKQIL